MLKIYYSSSDVRLLKELSVTMFEEVSSGVYVVIKDRLGEHSEFVTADDVVNALNNKDKVSVTDIRRSSGYANFNIDLKETKQ